jgi:hypothetical protein
MPIILATQEVEIWCIMFTGQSRSTISEIPISTNKKSGMVVPACCRRFTVHAGLSIKARPYSKNNWSKKAGNMVQVADWLPTKHKIMNSNPICTKKKILVLYFMSPFTFIKFCIHSFSYIVIRVFNLLLFSLSRSIITFLLFLLFSLAFSFFPFPPSSLWHSFIIIAFTCINF